MRTFLPANPSSNFRPMPPVNWLQPDFADRYRDSLSGRDSRLTLFGPRPSFQENLRTLNVLRRQLGSRAHSAQPLCESCYPYLDRDLLDFLYSVPREQLLRSGQRRSSVMRRALRSIVPEEILNRKRKGYVAKSPLVAIAAASPQLMQMSRDMVSADLGLVDSAAYIAATQRAINGLEFPLVPWMRTLALERWLRDLRRRSLLL